MVGAPESIGRYRVEAVIGAGGFATVYRARDDRLDATVAVKALAENHCFDPDVRERFLQEGRILRRIGGSHVVTVHDMGETERGQPYLVLDHADRGDLATRVEERSAQRRVTTPEDLLAVAGPLADALEAVHASGVVHRDLAPRNMLLRSMRTPRHVRREGLLAPDEELVLADLGLSKDLATASGLTVAGGTAGFTPPEQRDEPGRVDPRADLWAASAVVAWLALHHPPDDGDRWAQDMAGRGWPPALVEVLDKGLAARPADRWPTATDWFAALTVALAPPATTPAATTIMAPDPPRRPEAHDVTAVAEPATEAPARSRWSRMLARTALVLTIGAALGFLGPRALDDRDGPRLERTELADGRLRIEATDGDRRVAVTGPTGIETGETGRFEAEAAGVGALVWIGPDGVVHQGIDVLDVDTSGAGRATVRALGIDSSGHALEVSFDFRVSDP